MTHTFTWYNHSKDVQQKIHRDFMSFIEDDDMIHLTALVIIIQLTIHSSPSTSQERKTIFSPLYITHITKTIKELEAKHNWIQCASERRRLKALDEKLDIENKETKETKETKEIDLDECEDCYEFDSHVQLLRMSRLRLQLFVACRIPSSQPHRSLLYDMAALFVMLRRESSSENTIDIYLFFQVVYALTRLHHLNFIYLTNQTKNRYFTLWLMYFVEYSYDLSFFWDDYSKIVSFGPNKLSNIFRLLTALLFVRRQTIPDSALHVVNSKESWNVFVDQINQSYEVAKLRKAYSFRGFLFPLDVEKTIRESEV